MVINAFAKALEVIPRTIADNAGYIIIQFIFQFKVDTVIVEILNQ